MTFAARFERIAYVLLLGGVCWFLAAFLIWPILSTVAEAFFRDGAFKPWDAAQELAGSRRVRAATWNTLWMAALSTITVTVLGLFQVLALEFFHLRGRAVFKLACAIPLVFGGATAAVGFYFSFGPQGAVTVGVQSLFPGLPRDWFIGWRGVLVMHTMLLTMFHYLFLRAAMRRIDYSTIEAARALGASDWTIITRIVLPAVLPTLLAVTLLTLFYALNSFAAPRLLGGRDFFMLNEMILTLNSLRRPDMAALLAILLGIVLLCVLSVSQHFEKKGEYIGGAKTPVPIELRKIGHPATNAVFHATAYVMVAAYLCPVFLVVLFSFAPGTSIGTEVLPSTLTLKNYVAVVTRDSAFEPFFNSLVMSLGAALAAIILVLLAMPYVLGGKSRLARLLDVGFLLPWMVPNPLIAIGFILAFDTASWIIGGATLLGTYLFLPLCYVVIILPLVSRILRAAHVGLDPSLNDAARALGASGLYRYRRVTFPILFPTVVLVIGITFNDLLAEYPVSAFLYNINNRPLSIALVDDSLNSDPEQSAINLVYTTLIMGFSLAIILLAERIGLGKGPKVNNL